MALDYKARARQRASELNQSAWYKMKGAADEAIPNTFRILRTPPPKSDPEAAPWEDYSIHRDVGPKKQMLRCGKDGVEPSLTGRCYGCDVYLPKLLKQGKGIRAAAMQRQAVIHMQVAKVEEKDDGTKVFIGPMQFTPSKGVAGKLLANVFGHKKRDLIDPEKGYNITISRIGTGKFDTEYGMLEIDDEPSAVPAEIMKKLKPFDEVKEIPVYDEKKWKLAIGGGVEDEDEEEEDFEEDEEEAHKPKKSANFATRQSIGDSRQVSRRLINLNRGRCKVPITLTGIRDSRYP